VVFLVALPGGPQRAVVVGVAGAAAVAMVGIATLAHRSYGRADVGAAVGWAAIPISAAVVWTVTRGFGVYGLAAGCGLLLVINAGSYRAIGTGRWAYLVSVVLSAIGASAMLAHALGLSARTLGVVLAVAGVFACPLVSRRTGRLGRVEPPAGGPDPEREAVTFESPLTPRPSAIDSGAKEPSLAALPTAEAVWARVRSAAVTRSALYAGLAVSVLCGVEAVLATDVGIRWATMIFSAVCAGALGLYARLPGSVFERASLGVPAAGLFIVGCINAQRGTAVMAGAGLGALLAVVGLASAAGWGVAAGNRLHRRARVWAYLQYAAYAALIPVALSAAGVYVQLEGR
jgi:hypothetical protein